MRTHNLLIKRNFGGEKTHLSATENGKKFDTVLKRLYINDDKEYFISFFFRDLRDFASLTYQLKA